MTRRWIIDKDIKTMGISLTDFSSGADDGDDAD